MEKQGNEIGNRIRHYRTLRGMTQEELASLTGIHVVLIRRYEAGDRKPKFEQLQVIADALGIGVTEFIELRFEKVSDVSSLILQMESQNLLKISGKRDKKGNCAPSSVSITFENKSLAEAFARYVRLRDESLAGESSYVITTPDGEVNIDEQKVRLLTDDKKI